MPRITDRKKLIELADQNPDQKCNLVMCLGDLEIIGLPLQLFDFQKDDFAVVEGKTADKFNFCRQGLEPVVQFEATVCQAYVLTTNLPKFRWAIVVGKGV